jgi:hypothetical protein
LIDSVRTSEPGLRIPIGEGEKVATVGPVPRKLQVVTVGESFWCVIAIRIFPEQVRNRAVRRRKEHLPAIGAPHGRLSAKFAGRIFSATSRLSFVARAIDLTHAARANRGGDFIRPQTGAGTDRHGDGVRGLYAAERVENVAIRFTSERGRTCELRPRHLSSSGNFTGTRFAHAIRQ